MVSTAFKRLVRGSTVFFLKGINEAVCKYRGNRLPRNSTARTRVISGNRPLFAFLSILLPPATRVEKNGEGTGQGMKNDRAAAANSLKRRAHIPLSLLC